MNKKSTLLAAALMAVSSLTVGAAEGDVVKSSGWVAGNYYYLKNDAGDYLAIYPENQDSVVLTKDVKETKDLADLALWEITYAGTETSSNIYQFVNKKTKKTLSFAKNLKSDPIIAEGVDKWSFDESGKGNITAKISSTETMALYKNANNKVVFDGGTLMVLNVTAPSTNFPLKATDLGDGFSTFQLSFGDKIEGDIFSGKDLIASSADLASDESYVLLQEKGKEAEGYFGIDTLQTAGAGYNFSLDSIRGTVKPNEAWKKFKFTADLKNDSLTMWVCEDPAGNNEVKVVYMQLGDKKVLTVRNDDSGIAPFITTSRGVPAKIATGTGVYFLKSASKGANGGKYYVTKNSFMGGDSIPSVNLPRGQWLIATEGGKYSVVDRQSNSALIMNQEIFEVQGMKDTYLFGGDSVTVIQQPVDLKNKYLGSLAFTSQELVDNGFYLTLIPGTTGVNDLYAYTTDSILKGSPNDVKNASIFKLIAAGTSPVAGAMELGDTISVISYNLRGLFNTETIAAQNDSLKFSKKDNALSFRFISDPTSQKYTMVTTVEGENMNVGMNINTSCLQLTKNVAYVNLLPTEAPEYASFDNGHKRLTYNNNSLVMNPNTLLAEMKIEGNEIATKAGYEADNFSLWVEKAEELVDGKQLYLISSANPKANVTTDRFYLAANETLGEIRAVFAYNDTIKTAKGSHALFAFKTAEDGGFYLENQTELGKADGVPYVGMVNGFAVMQKDPTAAFEVESASAPVANENITEAATVRLIGSVGEFTIQNAAGKNITISNILGQTIGTRYISSDYVTVPTARGVIIVSVEGDKAYKVIVK